MTEDLTNILNEINKNSVDTKTSLILNGIILTLTIVKPILMYWIQAKYDAKPPYVVRSFNVNDVNETINNEDNEYINDNVDDVKISNQSLTV